MSDLTESYPVDQALMKKAWNLTDSFRYCERLTRQHYENFPVGSLLIPKRLRPHVCAIYAFARRADDLADEDFPEPDRIPALEAWQGLLEKSQHGHVNHPVFLALRDTIRRFEIPLALLTDLIAAFKMDVRVKRHRSFGDLLDYCRHSANPVGRLILLLFGHRDEDKFLLSDKICTALQLANFWQDVAVDWKKNRIYIPQEDMERFQYSEAELAASAYNARFRNLLAFEVERTEALFREGAPLVDLTGGRLGLELKCVVLGGMGICAKVRQLDYNTLAVRPHFQRSDKLRILMRACFGFKKALAPRPASAAPETPGTEGALP